MSLKYEIFRSLEKGPASIKKLAKDTKQEPKKIKKVLLTLLKDGKIIQKDKAFALRYPVSDKKMKDKTNLITCKIVKLGASFGFAAPVESGEDIFVPGRSLMGAMPGDIVNIALFARPRVAGSREGEVVEIVEPYNRVVGKVVMRDGKLAIVPDNAHDTTLLIQKNKDGGVHIGDKAAGEIVVRGPHHDDHRISILLSFGSADSAKECAKAILYGAGIEKDFPVEVAKEAKKLGALKLTEDDFTDRKDLRKEAIFTIDSASTKDIDDAISVRRVKKGYELGVHIADVSHYVTSESALDVEAMQRGTSVYYADSVIPMLPKELSNGICSLNPGEDRLAFSCVMQLDERGNLIDFQFHKTVINSKMKGVYQEINEIFARTAKDDVLQKYALLTEQLEVMHELYMKLALIRAERGSMEIETEEAELVLDDNGVCVDIKKRTRGDAEKMIEEFMLLANSAAAQLGRTLHIPFVYRVHEKPSDEKIEGLKTILSAIGMEFKTAEKTPNQIELAVLLDKTRGTNLEGFVHTGVLRSMSKAQYEPLPKGHFGLALEDYAHFTSPIRRYPDLAIHRILSDVVKGMPKKQLESKYKLYAQQASQMSSERELVAQRIERDCDDCYKAEYMRQFIGEECEGVISSVVSFGIYVQLSNTVEGLIHISRLSNSVMTLIEGVSLTDTLSGKSYRLGDPIRVQVTGVDVSQGNVDFGLPQTSIG